MGIAIQHSDKPQELYNEFTNAADHTQTAQKKVNKVLSSNELKTLFGSVGIKPTVPSDQNKEEKGE